jgi:putative DNA primase/helicase
MFRKDEHMEPKKLFQEVVAERLIEQLNQGTAPWQKPWVAGAPAAHFPMNPTTGKRYKGINAIFLMSQDRADQRWMTYRQAAAAGAQVRKGERGTPIQYWKFQDEAAKIDAQGRPVLDANGEPVMDRVQLERPRVFHATVFNAEQMDGLPPQRVEQREQSWTAVERAENILTASRATIKHEMQNRAYYRSATDSIHLPEPSQFATADNYYATALHELGHWTGHASRLHRDLSHPFGSQGYAKEELRAEIASMIIGDELGIGHDPGQHAAYVQSWIAVLKDDPLEIFRAAADAEKIQGFVMALEQTQEQQQEQKQEHVHADVLRAGRESTEVAQFLGHDIAQVLGDPNQSWTHFTAFIGPSLEAALRSHGFHTIADVTGSETADFTAVALERLSPVFGIAPSHTEVDNAYLQRKGLAMAFAASAEQIVISRARPVIGGDIAVDPSVKLPTPEPREPHAAAAHADIRAEPLDVSTTAAIPVGKTYLDVPYADKADAKALGAKWDRQKQSWYVPTGVDPLPLDHWRSAVQAPSLLQKQRDVEGPQLDVAVPTAPPHRQYLAVPYGDRVEAKAAGAQWDKVLKSWFIGPEVDVARIQRWTSEKVSAEQEPAMHPRDEFARSMRVHGLMVEGDHPIMDGNKHRVPVEGGKKGAVDGFYVLYPDGHPAGRIINNKTGSDEKWRSKGYVLDPAKNAVLHAEAAANITRRAAALAAQHEQAAKRVSQQLALLRPVEALTPYLTAKGVQAHHGAFTDHEQKTTFIPAIDIDNKVWSMQYIQDDGTKRFAKDSRKDGCFHAIGGLDALAMAPAIVIAEGYATAATLAEVLEFATVAAFDSGNLPAVAKALQTKYPDKPIVIAGDDDHHRELKDGKNPGREKMEEAARAVGAKMLLPIFAPGERDKNPGMTDFNDLASQSILGREGAERQLRAAVDGAIAVRSEAAVVAEQRRLVQTKVQRQGRRMDGEESLSAKRSATL